MTKFGNFLAVHFLFGQIVILLWQICYITGLIFIVANGQILKHNLSIWSHCWSTSFVRNGGTPFNSLTYTGSNPWRVKIDKLSRVRTVTNTRKFKVYSFFNHAHWLLKFFNLSECLKNVCKHFLRGSGPAYLTTAPLFPHSYPSISKKR